MSTRPIKPEHAPQIARTAHVLEWLASERARLEQELAHVAAQGQRMEQELRAFLLHNYRVLPHQPFTLDAESGVLSTPEDTEQPPVTIPHPASEG